MNSKKNVRVAGMLLFAAVAAFGTGCGGIGASGSVSPATFLLPGIGQVQPPQPSPAESGQFEDSPTVAFYSSDSAR